MADTDISTAERSDLTGEMKDYEVEPIAIEGAADQKETSWMNTNWEKWLGYYKKNSALKTAINAKATWTVGKGYEAEPEVILLLDTIKGWGKDTFNSIMENMIRVYNAGGDSYCEIIRDDDNLVNLKPLDPGVMRHVMNRQGIIIRFEQLSKVKGKKPRKFKPEDIFYLPRNRVADECHGNSVIEAMEDIILMRAEAMTDWKRALHRNVDPLWVIHLDTDDSTEIAAFKAKMDKARATGENMYIPKGKVVPELIGTSGNATLNPLPWIENLTNYFYEEVGVPRFIVGGVGGLTDAAVKIAYLAYQQTIEADQLFIEEQILAQLNLVVKFTFPASLESGMLSDKPKAEEPEIEGAEPAAQPNDMTTELEGRK